MSHQTFLIVCGILIGIPFVVACVKGNPFFGLIVGFITFIIMAFAAGHGASMFGVHLIGFIIGGFATAKLLYDD